MSLNIALGLLFIKIIPYIDNTSSLCVADKSIDLLHSVGVNLLGSGVVKLWKIIILSLIILKYGDTKLDHSVDSRGEVLWLIKGETGGQDGGFVHQPDEILNGLVRLVYISLLSQLVNDLMSLVELKSLLGHHVA